MEFVCYFRDKTRQVGKDYLLCSVQLQKSTYILHQATTQKSKFWNPILEPLTAEWEPKNHFGRFISISSELWFFISLSFISVNFVNFSTWIGRRFWNRLIETLLLKYMTWAFKKIIFFVCIRGPKNSYLVSQKWKCWKFAFWFLFTGPFDHLIHPRLFHKICFFIHLIMHSPFHNSLSIYSVCVHWISVGNYEKACRKEKGC